MKTYSMRPPGASGGSDYILGYAAGRVQDNPDELEEMATKLARVVYRGGIDFFTAWDALWFAAVGAGLPHLVAQARIGDAFANAHREGGEA